jgi:hypothetical protein
VLQVDVRALSAHCEIIENGRPAGELDLSRWRERATLTTPDGTWVFRRRGMRRLTAEQPEDNPVATATNTFFSGRWNVESPMGTYTVRRRFFRSSLTIERNGAPVGEVTRRVFSQSSTVDLSDNVPVWLQAFLAWIAMMQRRRDSAAAGGSAGG